MRRGEHTVDIYSELSGLSRLLRHSHRKKCLTGIAHGFVLNLKAGNTGGAGMLILLSQVPASLAISTSINAQVEAGWLTRSREK